jgi:ArsR family transcriptional regulator, lead/cadmium/zinc/bismuth-responsive transcriptional repressor
VQTSRLRRRRTREQEHNAGMHLVPADQRHRRIIDGDLVCRAVGAVGELDDVQERARRYALLADAGRLALLTAIASVPGISVSDLAIAARMNDTSVSHALRLLRAAGAVTSRKDGRVMRYTLADESLRDLLPAADPPEGVPAPGTCGLVPPGHHHAPSTPDHRSA